MKCYGRCFLIVFMLFSLPLFAEEPQLPTPAEVFQEAVDAALLPSPASTYFVTQAILAQKEAGDIEGIALSVEKLLPHIREMENLEPKAKALNLLACTLHQTECYDMAKPLFEETVQVIRENPDLMGRVKSLIYISIERNLRHCRQETVQPLLDEAEKNALESHTQDRSNAVNSVAQRYLQFAGGWKWFAMLESDVSPVDFSGNTDHLMPYIEKALELSKEIPDPIHRDSLLLQVVDLFVKMRRYPQALKLIKQLETTEYYYHTGSSIRGVLISLSEKLLQEENLFAYEGNVDDMLRVTGTKEFRPSAQQYRFHVIALLFRLGRLEEAEKWASDTSGKYDEASGKQREKSGMDEYYYQLALLAGKEGNDDLAKERIKQIEYVYHRNQGTIQLALTWGRNGHDQEAREIIMNMEEDDPENPTVLPRRVESMKPGAFRQLAIVQYEAGRTEEALHTIQWAGEIPKQVVRRTGPYIQTYKFEKPGLIAINLMILAMDYREKGNLEATRFFAENADEFMMSEPDSAEKMEELLSILVFEKLSGVEEPNATARQKVVDFLLQSHEQKGFSPISSFAPSLLFIGYSEEYNQLADILEQYITLINQERLRPMIEALRGKPFSQLKDEVEVDLNLRLHEARQNKKADMQFYKLLTIAQHLAGLDTFFQREVLDSLQLRVLHVGGEIVFLK